MITSFLVLNTFALTPITIVYYCSCKLEFFKNTKKIRKYLYLYISSNLGIDYLICTWRQTQNSAFLRFWKLQLLRTCFLTTLLFEKFQKLKNGNIFTIKSILTKIWRHFSWPTFHKHGHFQCSHHSRNSSSFELQASNLARPHPL